MITRTVPVPEPTRSMSATAALENKHKPQVDLGVKGWGITNERWCLQGGREGSMGGEGKKSRNRHIREDEVDG